MYVSETINFINISNVIAGNGGTVYLSKFYYTICCPPFNTCRQVPNKSIIEAAAITPDFS